MGFLDRFKSFRQETAQTLWTDTAVGKNEPSTFIPDLIVKQVNDRSSLDDLDQVARQDPVAKYIVYKLSENVFDDWFKFVDKDGKEIMLDVQRELRRLNAKQIFTQVLTAERTFGWAWLYTGKNKYRTTTTNGNRIASIDYFTPRDCTVYEFDELGQPKTLEIKVLAGAGAQTTIEQTFRLPAEDFILVRTRPYDRSYKGDSVIYSVWDDLTYIREIIWSMAYYDRKIGMGILLAFLNDKTPLGAEMEAKVNDFLERLSIQRAGLVDKRIKEMKYLQAEAGATAFADHVRMMLERVAAGCGIPKDVIIGLSAGALCGSEINVKALYATINGIQSQVESPIREVVRRMGHDDDDYEIDWNVRFAHDEEQRSKINMNKAQTLAIRSLWLTKNELRAAEGFGPIEGGDELAKADFQIGVSGLQPGEQTPDEREQTRNPNGEQL